MLAALLHLRTQHTDHREHHAIEANRLADGPGAGEQLGLRLGADHANMGALLVLGSVEKPALIHSQRPDLTEVGADSIHRPHVRVQFVLHRDILIHLWRNMNNARNGRRQAVHIVQCEAHLDARLLSARLFACASRERADRVGAPLCKDRFNRMTEARTISQQQHHRGDAPRHADHGDGGAATVVDHRLPGLPQNIFEHAQPRLSTFNIRSSSPPP